MNRGLTCIRACTNVLKQGLCYFHHKLETFCKIILKYDQIALKSQLADTQFGVATLAQQKSQCI